jgi:hypothetical protein
MKKIISSAVLCLALAASALAQTPGNPNGGLGGGSIQPDLIIYDAQVPSNASAGQPFTFTFTVRNRHNATGCGATKAAMLFR